MRFYFIWEGKLWHGSHFVILFMALPLAGDRRGFFRGIPGGPEHLLCVILSWSFEINMRAHVQDYTNGR